MLLLSEHWQSQEEIDLIGIQGFKLCSSFCRSKQKHGGVAIYCKVNIKTKIVNYCAEFSVCNVFECCGIELLGFDVVVFNVYRPPTGDIHIFLTQLDKLLDAFLHSNKFLVIGGDFEY